MKDDGYIHVAQFVDVVWYPKEVYKGVKKYQVSQGEDKVVESESEQIATEE